MTPFRPHPLRLGVNIDHVATVRNARGGAHPDPVRAAHAALAGRLDDARAANERAADVARRLGEPSTLGMSHAFALQLARLTGDPDDLGQGWWEGLSSAPEIPVVQASRAGGLLLVGRREDARAEHDRTLDRLLDLLRIPSVSTKVEHADDCRAAAAFLRDELAEAGLERAEVLETGGLPAVYAEWLHAPEGAPTVLLYGHYDVQPPEPLELWQTPPFEPTVRDGKLFARGSVDDKGQLYIHIKAAEALLKQRGKLPINLLFLAEGEEEVGSDNLADFVEKNAARLAADSVVISDS